MTTYVVGAGATSSGITLNSGDTLSVLSGGTASDTTVNNGGLEIVSAGGSAGGTIVNIGGALDFFGGAVVGGATVASGGTLILDDGAVASSTDGGATLDVLSGGTSVGTIGTSGATIDVTGSTAELDFVGNNTFDNATVDFGNAAGASISSVDTGGGAILTFGSGAVVNHTAGIGLLTGGTNGGDGIVNSGFINATASGGSLTIESLNFTNSGTITVRNGDHVYIQPTGNFTNFNADTLTGGTYDIGSASILELGFNQFVTTLDATLILGGGGAALQAFDGSVEVGIGRTLTTIGASGSLSLLGNFGDTFTNDLTINGVLSVQGTATATFNSLIVASDEAFVQLGGNTRVFGDISMQGGEAIALDPTLGTFVEVFGNITETGGSRGLVVAGGGMVQLDGTNTFTGGIRVNDSGTTLIISQDANLGDVAGGLTLTPGTTLELFSGPMGGHLHDLAFDDRRRQR